MAYVIALLSSDPSHLRCQIHRLRDEIVMGSKEDEALGLGYYADDDVLVAKRPSHGGTLDVANLAREVVSSSLVALSQKIPGGFDEDAVSPFRFRRWLAAVDGNVEGFADLRASLLAELPDLISRQIRSTSDREHICALFLKELKTQGRLDDANLTAPDAARCLGFAVRSIDRLCRAAGITRPAPLALAASNGRILLAARRGRPLSYALLEGLSTCELCGLDAKTPETDARVSSHRRCKAVALATEPSAGAGFLEIPDGSVFSVGRALDINISSL